MLKKECGKFTLQIELHMSEPEEGDFNDKKQMCGDDGQGLALQYGADFELKYFQEENRPNPIGILQFVQPSQMVGNPLGDSEKNIYIDKQQTEEQTVKQTTLKNYLFGNPKEKIISPKGLWREEEWVCVRKNNESVIRDTPREIIGYDLDVSSQTRILNKAPKLVFYDFMVEIQGEYCIIYPCGVKFEISVEQHRNATGGYLNIYTQKISELLPVNFSALKLEEILGIGNRIDPKSYKIVKADK